jgi:DNA-binding IclR family transcriptional regulator
MTTKDSNERYLVPGLVRGLSILQSFSSGNSVQSITDVAKHLDVSRSSAFRLIATLEYQGFIERIEDSKKYKLSAQILNLGFGFLADLDAVQVARSPLKALCDELRVSTHLVIRDKAEVVYLLRYASNSLLSSNIHIGSRMPAYATSHGQILLAGLSDDEVVAIMKGQAFEAYTELTPKTIAELISRLNEIRTLGVAISNGSFEASIASVAASIKDHQGKIVAAINATFPVSQFTDQELHTTVLDKVVSVSRQISRSMGHVSD